MSDLIAVFAVLSPTTHRSQSMLHLHRVHKMGADNDSIVLDQHLAENTDTIWLNLKNRYVKVSQISQNSQDFRGQSPRKNEKCMNKFFQIFKE